MMYIWEFGLCWIVCFYWGFLNEWVFFGVSGLFLFVLSFCGLFYLESDWFWYRSFGWIVCLCVGIMFLLWLEVFLDSGGSWWEDD